MEHGRERRLKDRRGTCTLHTIYASSAGRAHTAKCPIRRGQASKNLYLWRKVTTEMMVDLHLLFEKCGLLLARIVFQVTTEMMVDLHLLFEKCSLLLARIVFQNCDYSSLIGKTPSERADGSGSKSLLVSMSMVLPLSKHSS